MAYTTNPQICAINDYIIAEKRLRNQDVLLNRQSFTNQIGEWLVETIYNGERAKSGIQSGWDIKANGKFIQVKSHAKALNNNANFSAVSATSKSHIDELIIIIFSPDYKILDFYKLDWSEAIMHIKFSGKKNPREELNWSLIREFRVNLDDLPRQDIIQHFKPDVEQNIDTQPSTTKPHFDKKEEYTEIVFDWIDEKDIACSDISMYKTDGFLYCVYCDSHIYGRDTLAYIGKTINYKVRSDQHLKAFFTQANNVRFVIGFTNTNVELLEIPESILIANHKPFFNKQYLHDLTPLAHNHKIIVINNGKHGSLKNAATNYWWVKDENDFAEKSIE